MYGQLFTNRHGLSDNGTWFEILGDLTPKAIDSGVKRLYATRENGKFCDFPPNPLQFRALCLAWYEEIDLPSAGAAFNEIQRHASCAHQMGWSHPVVRYIAAKLPADFMRIDDVQRAWKMFVPLYETACNLMRQGHVLPKVDVSPVHVHSRRREIARQHLNEIKKILGSAS
ncbi:hypothetical protein [Legionella geestiana]|uniref:hypothetical protein n=1 Tax=Legionella geestiana TaxID=45065 RepID=UPI000E07224A|nr:hypothetical protein [Legionella geestiana]STX59205.1 Uncharacterised protein [Legionella geestiana]